MKGFNEIFFNQYYKDNKFIQYKNDDENIFNILYEKLKIDLNEEMLKKEKEDKIRKEKVQSKLKMVSDLQKKIEDLIFIINYKY